MVKTLENKLEAEAARFLENHPEVQHLDILMVDINGIFRGKRVPISALTNVVSGEIYLPITTSFLTTNGANAEAILDEYGSDPDRRCAMVPGSLQPVPWATEPTAQVLVYSEDTDGSPLFSNPRTVLARCLSHLEDLGLTPVVALEYEFFLFETHGDIPVPLSPPNGMPRAKDANCYNMDIQSDFEPILDEIRTTAEAQGINVTGIVCEYGNGQFEVNLNHQADAIAACDEAMMLKRVIRSVGHKHGLLASFMAKPLFDEVGSGLHVHVSLVDEHGQNIFAQDDGEALLEQAVAGLLRTMPSATPFFAPNANSYRRFDPEWFAPVVRNWGENNRRLSLRLPMSDAENRRVEHRVSGADACPHLVLACVIAGMYHGLKHKLTPGPSLGEFDLVDFADVLPPRWKMALHTLRGDKILTPLLGEKFTDLYCRVRESEEEDMHRQVGAADYEQYLRIL